MSDVDAIQAVRNGDKQRYAELVERHQSMVYGIAWSRLGDRDLCEEAAQETFIRAYRYLQALRDPSRFAGWLARIARNVSTSILRRRIAEVDKRRQWGLSQSEALDPSDEPTLGESMQQVLSNMPEQHRECLVLFYLEGKSIRETAALLGISETALKTRLHRARQALRGRLEETIEASLSGLRPRGDFTAGVMPLLPAMPLAAGVGGSSIAAKALSLFGKSAVSLSMLFWMAAANIVFMGAVFGWLARLEAANLAPGPAKDFRVRIIRKGFWLLILSMLTAMLLSHAVNAAAGSQMVFRLLVPLCLWQLYRTTRTLRFNRSPFTYGLLFAGFGYLLVSVLIGFFNAPAGIFFLLMLPLNLVLYQTNKSRPARHDYNLFLRQTQGLLGQAGQTAGELRVSRTSLKAFARFLGDRFLIVEYGFDSEGIVLALPPVERGMEQYLSLTGSNSSVRIGWDGRCGAHLGKHDLADLRGLKKQAPIDPEDLERPVAEVVRAAYTLFETGSPEQAEKLLQATADDEVFLKPIAKSRATRAMGAIAIVCSVIMVSMMWRHPEFAGFGKASSQTVPQNAVTLPMAHAAIAEWCREPGSDDFYRLLSHGALPTRAVIGEGNMPVYRAALAHYLRQDFRMHDRWKSRAVCHALTEGVFTKQELAELGVVPEKVRRAVESAPPQAQDAFTGMTFGEILGAGDRYIYGQVEILADGIQFLKELDCLDVVDSERLAHAVAARQVGPGWSSPPGHHPVDPEKAKGLFFFGLCSLEETHGALRILQTLNRLDMVNKAACIDGIMGFYKGQGAFAAGTGRDGIMIVDTDEERFHAMEALHILGALDRVKDLDRWQFNPRTWSAKRNGVRKDNVVTPESIASLAYQDRLEQLRGH